MRVTKSQLSKIIRKALAETRYYTSSGKTFTGQEAASKFDDIFSESSKIPWTTKFIPEKPIGGGTGLDPDSTYGTVDAQARLDMTFTVSISEARGQEYNVFVFYGDNKNASPYMVKEGLSRDECNRFIAQIDSTVMEMAMKRIKEGRYAAENPSTTR